LPRDAVWQIGTSNIIAGVSHLSHYAFAQDGKLLAVGRTDNTIQVLDISIPGHPKPLHRFRPPQPIEMGYLSHFALSPDGRRAAFAIHHSTVYLLDETGKKLAQRVHQKRLFGHIAFSPDGKTLMVCEIGGELLRIETATGKELDSWTLPGGGNQLCWSPDGKTVAVAGTDSSVHLLDATTGKPIRGCVGHRAPVQAVRFTRDGKQLLSLGQDGTLRTWDPATGKETACSTGWDVPREQRPFSFSVVPGHEDGVVLVHTPNNLHRLDTATGKRTTILAGTANRPLRVQLTPDGRQLLHRDDEGYIRLLDVASTRTGAVAGVAFSPDGKRLAVSGPDPVIRIWDLATRKEVGRIEGHTDTPRFLLFTPKGDRMVSACGSDRDQLITLWDIASSKVVRHFQEVTGQIRYVELSPDGQHVLAVTETAQTCLWELETGRRKWRERISVWPLFFTEDSKRLIGPRREGTLTEWDVANGSPVRTLTPGETRPHYPRLIGLSRGEKTALTLDNVGQITAWDLAQGVAMRSWKMQPAGAVRFEQWFGQILQSVPALGSDGRLIAFPADDGSVRLIETWTGGERRVLIGHAAMVHRLTFSKDGRYLATGSDDGTMILWDLHRPEGTKPGEAEMPALWTSLAQPDAERGDRAMRRLATLGKALLPELRTRLAALEVIPVDIAKLIEDLSSNRPGIRRRAQQELEKYGEKTERAVRKALDAKPALEERRRLEEILKKVTGGELTTAEIQARRIAELIRWLLDEPVIR
jgi:WD40 repeat protein